MKIRISPTSNFVIVAIFFFAAVIALRADTITVTNTNDSGPGSLRQALADANDGDTIDATGVSGAIILTSGQLLVDKSITILGPGADNLAVDGNAKSRVLYIGSGRTVTISGLTITNGNPGGNFGGGVYNDHSTLTIDTCKVSNNSAGFADGGGVYSDGSFTGATVTVTDSIFSGNAAWDGGGIYNDGNQSKNAATVTISNSTFSDNSVSDYGGGIYNFGESGNATVTLNKTTVSGNSAGNTGTGYGGGFYNNGLGGNATLMVDDSTFSDNSTFDGDGGGIANFGAGFGNATLAVSNSTFSGNFSIVGGGAIDNDGETGSASLMLNHCTFSNNFADAAGDSFTNNGQSGSAPVTLANTIFASASGNFSNVGGTITSLGYNLSSDDGGGFLTSPGDRINTDPLLGPLRNNGGPTLTQRPFPGSPVIDAGDPSFTPPPFYDQRGPGFDRVVNGRLDIGSFEVQNGKPTPTPTPRPIPTPRPRPTPGVRPTP